MRKHCGMWHDMPSIKRIQQSSITHSQSKMRLYCSKNRDEYKESDCIKACNHMLLNFLHHSRNRYVYFRNRAFCDQKSRAACAQSFAPWQQATIEITRRDHSIIACSREIHNGVILHAHPVRGESHNQRNTTGEVATTSPSFYNEPQRSHVLCVKAELGTTSTSRSQHHFVAIGHLERHMRKASHRGSKQQ